MGAARRRAVNWYKVSNQFNNAFTSFLQYRFRLTCLFVVARQCPYHLPFPHSSGLEQPCATAVGSQHPIRHPLNLFTIQCPPATPCLQHISTMHVVRPWFPNSTWSTSAQTPAALTTTYLLQLLTPPAFIALLCYPKFGTSAHRVRDFAFWAEIPPSSPPSSHPLLHLLLCMIFIYTMLIPLYIASQHGWEIYDFCSHLDSCNASNSKLNRNFQIFFRVSIM